MANIISDFLDKHTHSTSKKALDEERTKADVEVKTPYVRRRPRIEKKTIQLPHFSTGLEAREYVRMHKELGTKALLNCCSQIKKGNIKKVFIEEVTKLEEETSRKSESCHKKKGSKTQRAQMFGHTVKKEEEYIEQEPSERGIIVREVLGSMSSKEFSFKLLECQKNRAVTERRLNLDLNPHELYLIKSGENISIKTLVTYLEILDVHITYMKRKDDHGYVTFSRDNATFISKEYSTKLYDIPVEGSFDLLKFANENGLRLSFARNKTLETISTAIYPKKEEQAIVRIINNVLINAIHGKEVSIPALAKALHMSANGLDYFLFGVVDYDYKMVDILLKHLGLCGIYSFKDLGYGRLDEQDGNLYVILANSSGKIKGKHHLLCENLKDKRITDIVRILIDNNFVSFNTAKRKDVTLNQSIQEDHVDKHGKRNFHEYDKHELEELIKWKRFGIKPNEYCDYCRTRGIKISFYPTKDGRVIQLCDNCKDKVHPTNHYVKIIYTPNGGQNKRY